MHSKKAEIYHHKYGVCMIENITVNVFFNLDYMAAAGNFSHTAVF